jgi:hypothetical protein
MRTIWVVFLYLEVFSSLKLTNAVSTEQNVSTAMMVKRFQETNKKIEEWKTRKAEVCLSTTADEDPAPPDDAKIAIIKNLPSEEMAAGVDQDMLHLCATISGGVYEAASKGDFKEILEDPKICKAFPDLTVRWFQNGVTLGRMLPEQLSMDAPTFVGIIAGSTLILGWRGTVTIKDMLSDAKIDSIGPWKALQGLEVQRAYYDMITKKYFRSHAKDIQNYIKGNYSKKPNGTEKDGTPITRIMLTGHSLGGGLAQVAHLFLRAPPNRISFPPSPWKKLVKACDDVEIKTIAISAPMTTVLQDPSSSTSEFLKNTIEPDMRNFVFNADVVPRGYSDLPFIDDFVNAFINEESPNPGFVDQLAEAFVKLHVRIFEMKGMMEQAQRYRHVGKLIYYDNPSATPVMCVDDRASTKETGETPYFRDLKYDGPKTKVADTALENHMVLVTGPGLRYHNNV